MSDIEEPPSKLTKFQMDSQYMEGEVLEEGQEEWLSEGVLTDDDYNPAADQDRSGNTSQDETMASINDNSTDRLETSYDNSQTNSQGNSQDASQLMQDMHTHSEENIEETLNNFENSENNNQIDLPDDLDTFLIRKTVVGKVKHIEDEPKDNESDIEGSAKQSEDDGNDTDDLLRVLGDGDERRKKEQTKEQEAASSEEDDDEYIFEGAKVTSLKVAADALMRKYPATKAVPEDDDITDASSDEADTMKKMFAPTKTTTPVPKSTTPVRKSTTPVQKSTPIVKTVVKPASQPKVLKKVINVPHRPAPSKLSQSSPRKTYSNRRVQATNSKSLLKPDLPAREKPTVTPTEVIKDSKVQTRASKPLEEKSHSNESQRLRQVLESKVPARAAEPSEEKTHSSETNKRETQRMMRPEQMDEEVPTDLDSDSGEESLYDELPSSDSDTAEDWFSLDVRAERAGDYVPLLGASAHRLLSEEKRRVSERVRSLKESIAALAASGRAQAAQLRQATVALAELDAMLKAA